MTPRQSLDSLLNGLPEERLREVLDFAQFLSWREEWEDWQRFGRAQLARAYGPNEPEYSPADMKPELNP